MALDKIFNFKILSLGLFIFFSTLLNSNISLAKNPITINESKKYQIQIFNKLKNSHLHQSNKWLSLLHYYNGKSVITDPKFFLSKYGKTNPKLELEATIKGIFNKKNLDNTHIICKYPARVKFLTSKLSIKSSFLAKPDCLHFKNYLTKTSPEKIKIVFASENVNSLVSMMGHIFLKIEGDKKNGKKPEHAIGYFASFNKEEILSFLIKTISTGANGAYFLEPYHDALDKYNNREKRSLWQYELQLTKTQLEDLIFHIWEMKNIITKYKFAGHNCANALLFLLAPIDHKITNFISPIDTPIDAIRKIKNLGYIKKVDLLPASNYKFRMISDNLSYQQKKILNNIIKTKNLNLINNKNLQNQANLLYALRIILDYKLLSNKISQASYSKLLDEIYKRQKNLKNYSNNFKYEIKNPLKKAKSSNIKLGFQKRGINKDKINLEFYPVYNEILSNNSEYFSDFDLQLMNFQTGYYPQNNKFRIDNIDLFKVKKIIPYDLNIQGSSSALKINLERHNFNHNSQKLFPNFTFGTGLAQNIFTNNILIYSILNPGYSYFLNNDIFYLKPEVGIIFKQGSIGKTSLNYSKYLTNRSYKYQKVTKIEQAFFISQNFRLKLNYNKFSGVIFPNFREMGAQIEVNF